MIKDKKQFVKEFVDTFDPKNIDDIESALKELFSATLEKMLMAEMDQHLGYTKYDYRNKSGRNSRNGFKEKNIVSKYGESTIQVPRDREFTFQPQGVKKGQKNVHGIEDKILSMYAKGLSTRQISESLKDIYGIDTSHETISNITDKILPFIRDWQNRPLEASTLMPSLYR